MSRDLKEPSWDLYSAALILLFSFFQILQWPLSPKFLDIYYHLAVMKGFAEAGGYMTHAFWEYAPDGRPHLYPPVLHLLMLTAYRLGLSEIAIARLFDGAIYPLVLLTFWRVSRKILTPRFSFFALVILSSSYSFYLDGVTHPAFSLSLILVLLAFGRLERRNAAGAALCLGLSYYTHTGMAWLGLLAIGCYAFANKAIRPAAIRGAAGAFLLAAPFLLFQWAHRLSFQAADMTENRYLELDLALWLLAAGGVAVSASKKGRGRLGLAWLIAMLPLLVHYRARFFNGAGLVGPALLAALFLDEWAERFGKAGPKKTAVLALVIIVFFYGLAPVAAVDFEMNRKTLAWADRAPVHLVYPEPGEHPRGNARTIYFKKYYDPLVEALKNTSKQGDIVWTNWNYAGGLVALLAGRATSTAMLAEVRPISNANEAGSARWWVWFKDPSRLGQCPMTRNALLGTDLRLRAETELAYLYENPPAAAEKQKSRPFLPEKAALILLFGWLGLILVTRDQDRVLPER